MRARRADSGSSAQRMRATRRGVRAVRVDSFMTVDAGRRCRGVASRTHAAAGSAEIDAYASERRPTPLAAAMPSTHIAPRRMMSRHDVAVHRDARLRPACIDAAPAPAHPARRSSTSRAGSMNNGLRDTRSHTAPRPPSDLRGAIKIPAHFRVRGSSDIATIADLQSATVTRHYAAASFSFFSARAFTRTLAGFAGNQRSSPVNGSLPKRFFFAGTTCAVIFSRPGSVNSPAPFL